MNRRQTIVALLVFNAAAVACLAGPPARVWRVGFLSAGAAPESQDEYGYFALRRGLRDLGYVEGKNLRIDWRFAEGHYERLPQLMQELLALRIDVIVATPSQAIRVAQKATGTIPIVMAGTGDPVGAGFVASLARPGGNITGVSNIGVDASAKYLDLLHAILPGLNRLAVLFDPSSASHQGILRSVGEAAKAAGVTIVPVEARSPEEIEAAFARMKGDRIDALIAAPASLFSQQRRQIGELGLRHRIPTMGGSRLFAEAGGLMSYGTVVGANMYRAATYVDRILKGAKPADLPVEQPNRLELVINLKTAKALGIPVPQSMLLRADDLIR